MNWTYSDSGLYVLGYMPDIDAYSAFDTVEEYQSEYRKVTEKEEEE